MTQKRILPMPISIALAVVCFLLGFVCIFFGTAHSVPAGVRPAAPQVTAKGPIEARTTAKTAGVVEKPLYSMSTFYAGGIACILMGVICGFVGSLLCSWELQIREKGLVYQCRRQMHAMYFQDIVELNVYLNSRPMPYYRLRSCKMKRKVVMWLNEGEDDRMIELLDEKVPVIAYWKNQTERADVEV